MSDILDEIIRLRRETYAKQGPSFGETIPKRRTRPVLPFLPEAGVILEIKRASPSKGDIAPELDPVTLALHYEKAGATSISVLTEQSFFKGSLKDLVSVSSACPDTAFLRKDFLLYEDEIEISYRCGADAVLLIARILELPLLLKMAQLCRSFGMLPFIEVRSEADLAKLAVVAKSVTVLAGVNSRDLATFQIDPLVPARLISRLPCRAVFESGASTAEACQFARRLGFYGILIGEAAARNPEYAKTLVSSFLSSHPDWVGLFWREVAQRKKKFPLVKICGLTRVEDALLASSLGADLLGFVFAESPRCASTSVVRDISSQLTVSSSSQKRPLLIGVITSVDSNFAREALSLVLEGVLDAIQYHGDDFASIVSELENAGGPNGLGRYAVIRLGSTDDLSRVEEAKKRGEPRVLVDARVDGILGGTGTLISKNLLKDLSANSQLWLAGGINASNVSYIITEYSPELIDASSGLESSPGKKDQELLKRFFKEIHACL
ncbi:MAG TPA: bifunctional indole-3-glycerol phosphate synthase/phosphoribosylanthranilate isomerase [Treponemataceae bacterium]|nr:bifunctional indole-3-glycerol phosphate synthase/phosphoribosylanthranilate isomerase [Treponemataceae bacterium]